MKKSGKTSLQSKKDALINWREKFRGNGLGRKLMECVQKEYPECPAYIMSGNDGGKKVT